MMPTAPISTVLAAPLLWVLEISLPSYFLQLKSSLWHSSLSFVYSLRAYAMPYVLFQARLLTRWLQPFGLRLVAVLPPFLILWVRLLPSSPVSTRPRPITLARWTSGVLGLLMLISMASRYLRSVSPVWRQSIVAAEISCRDFFLVFLWGNTSSSCWEVWWMTLSITSLTQFLRRGSCSGGLQLIRVRFAVKFLLDHFREIAQAFFMKKV